VTRNILLPIYMISLEFIIYRLFKYFVKRLIPNINIPLYIKFHANYILLKIGWYIEYLIALIVFDCIYLQIYLNIYLTALAVHMQDIKVKRFYLGQYSQW